MAHNQYNPDCGYAWIVVAACFTINFIMAGLARAAGVLYIALIDTYGVSREVATTPFSLRFCVRNFSGPVVGALGQHFGIRPVVLLGGLICGLGGILSALAPDVAWITAAWGGIHGLGYGMTNIIHMIVVNHYFNKYKGLAIGISATGDCFGTFLLPPLMEFLLSVYDLRGTFLILAGISLNAVPAAMLLKSPPWEEKSSSRKGTAILDDKREDREQGIKNEAFDNTCDDSDQKLRSNVMQFPTPAITMNQAEKDKHNFQIQGINNDHLQDPMKLNSQYSEFYSNDRNKNKLLNDTLNLNKVCNFRESASLRIPNNKEMKKCLSFNFSALNTKRKSRGTSLLSVLSCPSQVEKISLESVFQNNVKEHIAYLESVDCVPYAFPEKENPFIQLEKSQDAGHGILSAKCDFNPNESQGKQLIIPIITLSDEKNSESQLYKENIVTTNELEVSDVSGVNAQNPFLKLLRTNMKPIFLIISATVAFYFFLFVSVFTIIIDYAADYGISSEYGKYLIIAFSVTDVFGRLGFGIVLDKKWIALRHFAAMAIGLTGLFVLIIPLYKCFTFWIISFSICGFFQGGAAIMFPILVENYMDKDEQSIALGSLNLYGGILSLPVPAMIGYFRDNIGSYDGVFLTVGAPCLLAASLWLLEPCVVRDQKRKLKELDTTIENVKY